MRSKTLGITSCQTVILLVYIALVACFFQPLLPKWICFPKPIPFLFWSEIVAPHFPTQMPTFRRTVAHKISHCQKLDRLSCSGFAQNPSTRQLKDSSHLESANLSTSHPPRFVHAVLWNIGRAIGQPYVQQTLVTRTYLGGSVGWPFWLSFSQFPCTSPSRRRPGFRNWTCQTPERRKMFFLRWSIFNVVLWGSGFNPRWRHPNPWCSISFPHLWSRQRIWGWYDLNDHLPENGWKTGCESATIRSFSSIVLQAVGIFGHVSTIIFCHTGRKTLVQNYTSRNI